MGLRELADKTTIANVVAAVTVLAGLAVVAYGGDYEAVKYVMASAIGYLFGRGASK